MNQKNQAAKQNANHGNNKLLFATLKQKPDEAIDSTHCPVKARKINLSKHHVTLILIFIKMFIE